MIVVAYAHMAPTRLTRDCSGSNVTMLAKLAGGKNFLHKRSLVVSRYQAPGFPNEEGHKGYELACSGGSRRVEHVDKKPAFKVRDDACFPPSQPWVSTPPCQRRQVDSCYSRSR